MYKWVRETNVGEIDTSRDKKLFFTQLYKVEKKIDHFTGESEIFVILILIWTKSTLDDKVLNFFGVLFLNYLLPLSFRYSKNCKKLLRWKRIIIIKFILFYLFLDDVGVWMMSRPQACVYNFTSVPEVYLLFDARCFERKREYCVRRLIVTAQFTCEIDTKIT